MEIIEKIHLTFDNLDEERVVSIARICSAMVVPFQLNLAFCGGDQTKLEIIQSKRKEVQEKIKEVGIKSHYAVDLYMQHLDIECKKEFNGLPFYLPLIPDDTSIFKVEIIRFPDAEEGYIEVDHVECALINAQKAAEESILWIIFYSELEDMEEEVKEEMNGDQKNVIVERSSTVKETGEELKIEKSDETLLQVNGILVSSKYLQIFKKGGYEIFCYLQIEYTLDDHSPVAKYSYIYHFLAYEQLITARSQAKYIEFIKETYGINMSKIFPKTDKFNDDILHLLSQLKSNFERNSKSEMNRK